MNRRLIGIAASVLLALLGTVALVAYVSRAEERARAGEELIEVYVVTTPIASGTPAEELDEMVTVEEVPTKVRASGAVDSLPGLAGRVTAVDLLPGEQLVDSRFIERSELADRQAGIEIPEDMVEVTIELEPQRAVGGLVKPGNTVAVLASYPPFQLAADVVEVDGDQVALPAAVAAENASSTANTTDILLRKALVTAVQEVEGRATVGGDDDGGDRLTTAPEDVVFVTLAVRPFDAERLVFTAEFGTIWLAIERETVPETDDGIRTRGSIYLAEVQVR